MAVIPSNVPRAAGVAERLGLLGVDAVIHVEAITIVRTATVGFGQLLDVEPGLIQVELVRVVV